MGKSHYLSVCLLAGTPLLAQGMFVSPPALATVEGNDGAYYLLGYAESRFQYAEGELRGKALSLSDVAFRLDYRNHTSDTAMGRAWTKVTLNVAETDWTKMTATFSENQFTTPVQVFNAAYDVPSVEGTPVLKPTPFGNKYAFPFKSPYAYSGVNDLLLDFAFLGGTMDNGIVWGCGNLYPYYLDGNSDTTTYRSMRTTYPVTPPIPPCRDSAIVNNLNAYTFADLMVHGITHSNVMLREKASFEMYSYYTAPNANIISAIGFSGNRTGVDLSARCNLLYVNLETLWFAVARTTTGSLGFSGTYDIVEPWAPRMANMQIWVQTAWDDSKINAFSLTQAMTVEMPSEMPTPRRMVCTYSYLPAADTGFNPEIGSAYLNPITRYTYE